LKTELEEGKFSKGGQNNRPITPRPPAPIGQGSKTDSDPINLITIRKIRSDKTRKN